MTSQPPDPSDVRLDAGKDAGERVPATRELDLDWEWARRFMLGWLDANYQGLERTAREDLAQEASVRLLRTLRREPAANLEALMTTIVRRTAVDALRSERRRRILGETLLELEAQHQGLGVPGPGDPQQLVEFTVREFFHAQRATCVDLADAYFKRRHWQTVAAQLGATYEATRARWHRCLELLRSAVAQDPQLKATLTGIEP